MDNPNGEFGGNTKRITIRVLPILLIVLMLVMAVVMSTRQTTKKAQLTYQQVVSMFQQNQIESYELNLSNRTLVYTKRGEKTPLKYTVPNVELFLNDVHELAKRNSVKYNYVPGSGGSWLLSVLPSAVTMLLLVGLMFFMFRRINSTMMSDTNRTISFGKARVKTRDENNKVTFDDVAGCDEEKEELRELVTFLRDPERFQTLGARVPKGVLLVGPPGTGKTLLAKAVAGEADVPFFSISGSDFVEMYVGVGASRVRDLFNQAKKASPSIIFIDEIDAVGRHRGAGMGGGHDEREQTLNQMLVEMDGFAKNESVIIIAATNRPDILDPALLRPGRIDRQVMVGYPDIKGREAILKVHAKGKPIGPDVQLDVIAKSTAGFTGADLENLLNEAALLAGRRGKHAITMDEIKEATVKVVVGTEKRSHKMSDKEKRITAYHEAGHAVAAYYMPDQDPVQEISIIPRGMAGGYTMQIPDEDRSYESKKSMLQELVVLLGGRVSEALTFDDITTGASNDIQRASDIARKMVTKYGMSRELGPISFTSDHDEVFLGRDYGSIRNYSENIAAKIDEVVGQIMAGAYTECEEILTAHADQVKAVAEYLIVNEKADAETFKRLMGGASDEAPEQA